MYIQGTALCYVMTSCISLPGELRLAPHVSGPGWHACLIIITINMHLGQVKYAISDLNSSSMLALPM